MNARAQQALATGASSGNDAFTKLLLHGDGADASTTIIDSSPNGFTVTANGNAQIDTAQSKFGGGSILFDGTGDYASLADQAAHEIGAGDFTIEAWIRFNVLPAGGTSAAILQKGLAANSDYSYSFFINNNSSVYLLVLDTSTDGVTTTTQLFRTWTTPTTGVWYHVVVIKVGTIVRFFVDGTQVGADLANGDTAFNGNAGVTVGAGPTGARPLNGWLDETRLSVGVARWITNFTPPTAPYY